MKVTYTPAARHDDRGYLLMQAAGGVLAHELGHHAATLSAAWDRDEDRQGRPLYILTLRDGEEQADGVFDQEELSRTLPALSRIRRVWDDILSQRIRQSLSRMREGAN